MSPVFCHALDGHTFKEVAIPYRIVKKGTVYTVVTKETSKVHGHHASRKKAKKQLAALYANAPG